MVRMRFERYEGRPTVRVLTGLFESDRLGMDHVVVGVCAFADNLTVSRHDDAADKRVRADESDTRGSQFQGTSCLRLLNLCEALCQICGSTGTAECYSRDKRPLTLSRLSIQHLIKQPVHIALGVEHHQVIDLFADADIADRQV